jgi:hypothetical protein
VPVSGRDSLSDISCPTTSFCAAVDQIGNAVVSTDPTGGASTWSVVDVDGRGRLASITCPTEDLCLAGDTDGNVVSSTDPTGGASAWSVAPVDPSHDVDGISCPTTSFCVAADQGGHVLTSADPTGGAAAWQIEDVDYAPLMGVSCPTTTSCVVVDYYGSTLLSRAPAGGPSAWSRTSVDEYEGWEGPTGVSCASATSCVVVDGVGEVISSTDPFGGAYAWSETRIDPWGLTSISCTASFCAAVDNSGDVLTSTDPTGGSSAWSVLALNGPTAVQGAWLGGVSCASPGFCAAVDSAGDVALGTAPNPGPPSPSGAVTATAGPTDAPGSGEASLAWSPATPNGQAVTGYTIEPSPQCSECRGLSVAAPTTSTVVTGLTPGISYEFTVTPLSASGAGVSYAPSGPVVPTTVPGAPASVTATLQLAGTVRISFPKPAATGGRPLKYVVTTSPPCTVCGGLRTDTLATVVSGLTKGTTYTFSVQATNADGSGAASPPSAAVRVHVTEGFWLAERLGTVEAAGAAPSLAGGPTPIASASNPVVGIAATSDGRGYLVATADGAVAAYGDAKFYGDLPHDHVHPNRPVVAIAETADDHGYWLLAADGGLFTFGDAKFRGSVPGLGQAASGAVAMGAAPSGVGYWMTAADGKVWKLRVGRVLRRPPDGTRHTEQAGRRHAAVLHREGLLARRGRRRGVQVRPWSRLLRVASR